MLSKAWCWTNKAASFLTTLHEYWRLQLIKWQHRQRHQATTSKGKALILPDKRNKKATAPVWSNRISQDTNKMFMLYSLLTTQRKLVLLTGKHLFVSLVTIVFHYGFHPAFHSLIHENDEHVSQQQRPRVNPDTQPSTGQCRTSNSGIAGKASRDYKQKESNGVLWRALQNKQNNPLSTSKSSD